MADRGIIFSAPMVRALLDGRKTQTRRISKVRKGLTLGQIVGAGEEVPGGYQVTREMLAPMPYAVGDRLYVREAFRATALFESVPPRDITAGTPLQYCADQTDLPWGTRYRHARFMPRWASRLTLIVESVRVERVADISENDCYCEGLERPTGPSFGSDVTARDNARNWYRNLWNSLHNAPGERWEDNPWVVAIGFRVIRANIDQIAEAA